MNLMIFPYSQNVVTSYGSHLAGTNDVTERVHLLLE